jgi:GTP cyclohydrolase FolE2
MPDGQFISPCWKCKCEVWLPTPLYKAARHSSRIVFFCPYGHEAVFSEDETEADKLRRERDRLLQRTAQLDDVIAAQKRELFAERELVNNLKTQRKVMVRRAKAGTCPCCHRTFRQMALHMRNKHPEFKAEEAA